MPKFVCYANEREAVSSRLEARVHAIKDKVVLCSYETTGRDVVKQLRDGNKNRNLRVFPCENEKDAQALAKVLA